MSGADDLMNVIRNVDNWGDLQIFNTCVVPTIANLQAAKILNNNVTFARNFESGLVPIIAHLEYAKRLNIMLTT
jgi:hypothetical protein